MTEEQFKNFFQTDFNQDMYLSVGEIMDLNKLMIGRGIPDRNDDLGYNKPDYNSMLRLSYLKTPYSLEEAYVVLKTLKKYGKTQLQEHKNRLDKTLKLYDQYIKDKYAANEIDIVVNNAKSASNHTKDEFDEKELNYYDYNDGYFGDLKTDGVLLSFQEFVEGFNVRKYGGKFTSVISKKDFNILKRSAFCIPLFKLKDFINDCKEFGEYGYKPNAKLNDFIQNDLDYYLEGQKKESERIARVNSSLTLKNENRYNDYGHMLFSFEANNDELTAKLWEQKAKCLVFVDTKSFVNKTVISVRKEQLENLMNYCIDNNINCDSLKEYFEAKNNANVSNNKLLDLTKLNLPFKPYDFQIEDAQKIVSQKKALIGHDMGCGKTFISTLVGMSINEPKLVICPESLRLNWKKELNRVDKDAEVKIVYSNDENFALAKDWTICGYQTAAKFKEDILKTNIDCLFVDESHNIKACDNYGKPASQRADAVMSIAKNSKYCYLLTGTPIPTRNKDLYNQLVMLGEIDPKEPYAFAKYGRKYCDATFTGYGTDYSGNSNSKELHNVLEKYMTRRLKREVLPNLKKQRMFIPINGVNREYLKIEEELINMPDDKTYMGLVMTGRRLLSRDKIAPAIDLANNILSSEESVVLVSSFDETLDKIMKTFGSNACCIKGGMSDEAKQKAIDDFQLGNKKVCALNVIAGGVGITLTKAHNMIICDYDWTPANMNQVEDRICRVGQNECCNIHYMYNEDALLDKVFVNMITEKSANIDKVVDGAENTMDFENDLSNSKSYFELLKEQIEILGGNKRNAKKEPYMLALKQVLDANKKENLPNIDFKTETMLKHGIKPSNNGKISKKQVFEFVYNIYKANGGVEDIKPQTPQELQETARKQFEQDVQKDIVKSTKSISQFKE